MEIHDRFRTTIEGTISSRLPGIAGSSARRSFVPWYAYGKEYYDFWKNEHYYPTSLSNYNYLWQSLSRYRMIRNSDLYEVGYKNIVPFTFIVANGIIYQIENGLPKIHFLVTRNTGVHELHEESVRYFLSTEFFSSEKFKYIYKRLKKDILDKDNDCSIVVVDNIFKLFYDRLELPQFNNLEERISFEENITDILVEEDEMYEIVHENG